MKNDIWFWCMINTSLIAILTLYILLSKNLGNEAYNRCEQLEKELVLQKERYDYLSGYITKKDSIVININYNSNGATPEKKK